MIELRWLETPVPINDSVSMVEKKLQYRNRRLLTTYRDGSQLWEGSDDWQDVPTETEKVKI